MHVQNGLEALEQRRLLSVTLWTLTSFDGTNEGFPTAGVTLDPGGDLFGTATSNNGTAFELPSGSSTISTLASFTEFTVYGGGNPSGLTRDSGGDLFGTLGTTSDANGAVFEIAAGSNTVTSLAAFTGGDGQSPTGGVTLDSNGDFYGTTQFGGTDSDGTVFSLAAGGGVVTTLASFDGTNGQNPNAGVIFNANGNMLGTTAAGGANGDGTVFVLPGGSNAITALASFDGTDGQDPQGGITLDSSGNMYGTAEEGGNDGFGVVFEIPAGSSTITDLASFDGTDGENPFAGVTLDSNGDLFGTTKQGGSSNDGTVFEMAAGTNTITTLASFGGSNGEFPVAAVTLDSAGNLYGTTEQGGSDNDGTVFEIPNAVPPPPPPPPTVLAPLALDTSFGAPGSGIASLEFTARAETVDSFGRIILGGYEGNPSTGTAQTVLERLNSDGTVDSSFGAGGLVVGAAGSGAFDSVAIDSSGLIVAGGSSESGQLLLERFTSSGSPDASFGSGGITTVNMGANAAVNSIAIDSAGNIVAAGTGGNQFAIARFTSSGSLDGSFASGGSLSFNIGSDDVLSQALIQSDGKVLLAGGSGADDVIVARLNSDGSFDSSFGGSPSAGVALVSGLVPTDITPGVPDASIGLALQSDGTILVANQAQDGHFGVAELTSSGQTDSAFGSNGLAEANFGGSASPPSTDDADAISVDPSTGETLVTGTTDAGGIPQVAVADFLPNGSLDTSFASGGMLMLPTGTLPTGSAAPSVTREGFTEQPDAYYGKDFYDQAFLARQAGGKALIGISGGPNMTSTLRRLAPAPVTPLVGNSLLQVSLSGTLPISSLVSGQKVKPFTQTVRIANPTANAVSGTFTIELLLSGNTTGTTADPVLAKAVRRINLKAGKSVVVPLTIRSLPGGLSGSQYVLASVTDPNSNLAVVASSNTITLQAPYVDISGNFVHVPATAKAGRSVPVSLSVTEDGNAPVSGTLPIQILASLDGLLDANSISLETVNRRISIQPGHKAVLQVSVPLKGLAAGSYTIIAQLDPANTLRDADLLNNTAFSQSPLTVQ